jgi:hypothetical protein
VKVNSRGGTVELRYLPCKIDAEGRVRNYIVVDCDDNDMERKRDACYCSRCAVIRATVRGTDPYLLSLADIIQVPRIEAYLAPCKKVVISCASSA